MAVRWIRQARRRSPIVPAEPRQERHGLADRPDAPAAAGTARHWPDTGSSRPDHRRWVRPAPCPAGHHRGAGSWSDRRLRPWCCGHHPVTAGEAMLRGAFVAPDHHLGSEDIDLAAVGHAGSGDRLEVPDGDQIEAVPPIVRGDQGVGCGLCPQQYSVNPSPTSSISRPSTSAGRSASLELDCAEQGSLRSRPPFNAFAGQPRGGHRARRRRRDGLCRGGCEQHGSHLISSWVGWAGCGDICRFAAIGWGIGVRNRGPGLLR